MTVPATPELASAAPATADTDLFDGPPPARGGRLTTYLPLALLLLLLAGALVAWFGPVKEWRREARVNDLRADALSEVRQLALNIGSIDHSRLDADLKRISDSTTGKARTEFEERILGNEAYKKLVRDNQAVLKTTIIRIGLQPCGTDDGACNRGETATVLVFHDQESRNKLRPTPRVDRNRVALTLVRQNGKWLISEVAVL